MKDKMNPNDHVSFVEFNQKLLKYCANSVICATQEKEIVSRFERLVTQRDACLDQLIKAKELELSCGEDIVDLQHQNEEALELMESIEKRMNLLVLEHLPPDANQQKKCDGVNQHPIEGKKTSSTINQQQLNRMLAKFCNLYVQFDGQTDVVQMLCLSDKSYFEFSLAENNSSVLREQIWTNLSATSVHLNSWEQFL